MSADSIAEKVSSLPMSQGKARCRLSQLLGRKGLIRFERGSKPMQAGDRASFEPLMGGVEIWRATEAGKDPLLEREP